MNATPPHIARVPRIAITPGEPAGIGPDLCVTLAQRAHGAELVAVADPVLLMQRAAELHLPLALLPFDRALPPQPQAAGTLRVAPVPLCAPTRAGVLDAANAAYVLDTLRRAAEGCVDTEFDALVPGPVHKGVINAAGEEFSGHAEFLADLAGPLPADTLFIPKYLDTADAVLAMYHDQGLPVLKFKGFGKAVNITLGLPIVRTSVDHGTALELAGKGGTDTGSLVAALQLAREITARNAA